MSGYLNEDIDFTFKGRLDDIRSSFIKNLEMNFECGRKVCKSECNASASYWDLICSFEKKLEVLCEAEGFLLKVSSISPQNQKLLEQMDCLDHQFLSKGHVRNYELIKKDGGLYPMTYNFVLESYKACPEEDTDAGFNFFEFVWDHIPLWNYQQLLYILEKVLSSDVSEYQKEVEEYVTKYNSDKRVRSITENILSHFLGELCSELDCRYKITKYASSCGIEVVFDNDIKLYFELDYEDFVSDKQKIQDLITVASRISSYGFRKISLGKAA